MRTFLTLTPRSSVLHLCMIALLCCLAYSNTFRVPFHFDDKLNIADNAMVKDLANFWPLPGNRWFGYLTFALNYQVNGLRTPGYHVVNLAIHILSSFLVYWLVLLTLKTPYCAGSKNLALMGLCSNITYLALGIALLFACHPVQTQAVTYIVQRFASLAGLLYLLSLALYVKARLLTPADNRARLVRASWYLLSVAAAVLAMQTKENAFTLPVVIALYDLSFLGTPYRSGAASFGKGLRVLLPFILILLAIALLLIGTGSQQGYRGTYEISRTDYLLTQFPVIVTYIRLLLLPVNQSIDYDIPVHGRFFDPIVFGSFLVLVALASACVFLFARSRKTGGPERLIAFGILWFLATLSVESSIIPLPDVIFEHRLYLPSFGAFLAFGVAGPLAAGPVVRRYPLAKRFVAAATVLVVLALTGATFARNSVWSSEMTVWEDAVAKYPGSYRAYTVLGGLYRTAGMRDAAKSAFLRSLALNPSYSESRVNLGSLLVEEGKLDEAMREFMTAVQQRNMDEIDTGYLFINIGNCYRMKGMIDQEIEYYQYALNLIPGDAVVHSLLGRAYQTKGMQERAREAFARAHQLNPDRY